MISPTIKAHESELPNLLPRVLPLEAHLFGVEDVGRGRRFAFEKRRSQRLLPISRLFNADPSLAAPCPERRNEPRAPYVPMWEASDSRPITSCRRAFDERPDRERPPARRPRGSGTRRPWKYIARHRADDGRVGSISPLPAPARQAPGRAARRAGFFARPPICRNAPRFRWWL